MQLVRIAITSALMGIMVLALPGAAAQTKSGSSLEYPTPIIREEQIVVVGGRTEVWQLRWTTPPKPVCEPSRLSLTCPCSGFAYGEGGDLTLLRTRNGKVLDHLDLSPFFIDGPVNLRGTAVVPRWDVDDDKDFEASERQDFPNLVAKRPVVQVMYFADYERDGWGNEFYLQTESPACGHTSGILIGVTNRNPHLHAVVAASAPGKALYLHKQEWDALRQKLGPFEILDWPCGDHGADTETRLWLHWTPQGVDGTRREYSCSPDDKPGKLLHEKPLSNPLPPP
jgi:hypothetical protein